MSALTSVARHRRASTAERGRFIVRAPSACGFLLGATCLAALHLSGVVDDLAMAALSIASPAAILIGVRKHRPQPSWPWLFLILAGVMWSAAGGIRAAVGATGDLTSGRNLLPDAFAIVGYAIFAIALLAMLRAQGVGTRSRAVLLDGGILAVSAMLFCWVALIAPVLYGLDAAPIAKLSILVYPPISAFLVSIAARLSFSGTSSGAAHRLLLSGMLLLLVGDVAYIPLEAHLFDSLPGRVLELPYALAYGFIGAAALHPTMRDAVRTRLTSTKRTEVRFALIGIALLTPALMLLVWSPNSVVERIVVGGLAVALEVSAVARVVIAARGQAEVEARLAYRATHDELTGLMNRAAIRDLLDQKRDDAIAHGATIAVLFIDLDRFKLINDSYGHAVGDELLLAAAERLKETVGDGHAVARLSGDEFLIVAPGLSPSGARSLASSICVAFSEPFELIGTVYITASVGVVVADPSDALADGTALIRDADTAMYEAKAAGRSAYVVFDPSMRAKSEHKLEMYNGLHLAIERNEFEVYYQVIVDPRSGTVRGVEALVRWISPQGLIPPDHFIPLAEESGLISPIGEFVLRQSCLQVSRWRGLPGCADLTVSVNVSTRQLVESDMVAVVSEALADTGLPADALWLEITESVMMSDTLETLASLTGLRELGAHLSVDDFGTGYSSLSYLQRYPIEQVKVDRQFVTGLCDRPEDAAVVAAIVGMADALNLSWVAEGVERADQAAHLCELGCELVQGYLYSKPVPAIDLGPILLARNEVGHPPASGSLRH
jgi:diguanylate cyclase (GGDEF)-like protein